MSRIAVIGPLEMPNPQGGMSRHCEELYARLAASGHDVTVLCRATTAPGPPRGATHRGMRVRALGGVRRPSWDRLWYGLRASLAAARGPYDLVHYHSFASSTFCFLPRLFRRRVVVTVHRLEWQDAKWGLLARAVLRASEWVALQAAQLVICVSRSLRDDLERRYPSAGPLHYLANGVVEPEPVDTAPLESLGVHPGALLMVGRLVPEKGVHVALDAFGAVVDDPAMRARDTTLLVVGGARHESEYAATLDARAARSGGRIRLLGIQTGPALAALYRHALALVAPSFQEGQPLTVLEAMSCGLDVIASDIPAHRELVAGWGRLVPTDDVEAWAAAMQSAVADPDATRRRGAAGRARLHERGEYDWDRIAARTADLLAEL